MVFGERLYSIVICIHFSLYSSFILNYKCQIPEPKFQALWPSKGLQVSITDTGDIKNFVFHGRLNEVIGPDDLGKQWSQNTIRGYGGRFTIYDYKTKLKTGDKIYYRILVGFKNLKRPDDYRTLAGFWIVDGYVFNNGTKVPNSLVSDSDFCIQSETTVNGINVCVGQLIFNEDFNTSEISTDKWIKEHRNSGPPDYEFVIYSKNETNSYVKDGVLVINPTLLQDTFGEDAVEYHLDLGDQCTGRKNTYDCMLTPMFGQIQKPVLSAKLITKTSFRFGRIEIRAKLPTGKWLYPELYLEPKNVQYSEMANCATYPGQMRIAFKKGSDNILSAGLLRCCSEPERMDDMRSTLLNTSEAFHDFSFEWQPGKITVAVDGISYGEVLPSKIRHMSQYLAFGTKYNTEVNLIIGLGAGGINDFPDGTPGKPWENRHPKNVLQFWQHHDDWWPTWRNENGQLQIDYVKIYAL